MTAIPAGALVIPTTTAPYQSITVTLGNQNCLINLYTKSIFAPKYSPVLPIPSPPLPAPAVPPQYENINPVFIDLYVDSALIIGGVLALNAVPIVRDAYLGFAGDLAIYDTQAEASAFGVPARLPPLLWRNAWQLAVGPADAEYAPASLANSIPDMGTRFQLVYLPASS